MKSHFLDFHSKRKAWFAAQRKWNQNHLQVKKEADSPVRCLDQLAFAPKQTLAAAQKIQEVTDNQRNEAPPSFAL